MKWRTLDIVVAAVVAVAFGVVFWAWDQVWTITEPAFTAFPPSQAILCGVWLLPAVLGALIIRKPGAATFCLLVAAIISALLGNRWGAAVVWQGLLEGLGAELAFAVFAYRRFTLPVALLGGALAGIVATAFDWVVSYPTYAWGSFKLPYMAFAAVSALLIAGLGGWLLTRALAQTGVLDRFPSGRDRELV